MTTPIAGQSASFGATFSGRDVLGIPTAENLAVDVNVDLAIDADVNLDVTEGVNWAGATAAQSFPFAGPGNTMISETNL